MPCLLCSLALHAECKNIRCINGILISPKTFPNKVYRKT
jgi:hypothetical protein